MNRIAITLAPNGDIQQISSDARVEIFFVDPNARRDRVYRYDSARIGPQFVQEQIGGYAVGHAGDGTLGEFSAPHRPPSRPALRLVHNAAEATEPNMTSAGPHPDLP